MDFDLMGLVKEQLAEAALGKLGQMVGLGEKETEKALGGAIPAVLGGFLHQASTPTGLQRVSRALDEANDTIVDDVLGFLGGDKSQLFDIGGKLIGWLFGSKERDVTEAVGRSTGVNARTISSLLKVAGPIVAAFLARRKKEKKLDDRGVGDLLNAQRPWLKKVLPPEIGSALGFDEPAAKRPAPAPAQPGFLGRLLPLIILVALAFFAWKLFFNKAPEPAKTPPTTAAKPNDVMADALRRVERALTGVENLADVQSAVPVLLGAADDLQGLIDRKATMSMEDKVVLGNVAKNLPELLTEWTKPAGAIAGAQQVLEPALRAFGQAIDELATWVD